MHKTIQEQYQIIPLSTSDSALWSCVLCLTGGSIIRGMKCAVEYYVEMIDGGGQAGDGEHSKC